MKPYTPKPEQVKAAQSLMLAMAYRDLVEPIVTAYQTEILVRHQWPKAECWRGSEDEPKRAGHAEWFAQPVLSPDDTWLLSDEHFAQYLAECLKAQAEARLVTPTDDHCPKLVARAQVLKAQQDLVAVMEPVSGITWDKLMRKVSEIPACIDLYLRLLAPFVGDAQTVMEGA